MGDMPDFGNMSEDEMMLWLESLAKRQGAHEGFTTSADMEVAEIDPNSVVIDEPGYTPYYSSSKKPAATPEPTPAPEPPTPVYQEPPAPVTPEPAMASASDQTDTGLGDMDPMKWLESLAKRQGAYEGFTTSADMEVAEIDPDSVVIDEPGYTPYYSSSKSAATPTPPPPSEVTQPPAPVYQEPPAPVTPEPAVASASDQTDTGLGDMDPMKWLESLAKRQGAYEGFTTSADMEVAEIDPDSVVIDEPGYTPYYSSSKPAATPTPPPPPAPEPEPVAPVSAAPSGLGDGELPSDIDPMKWLESLAKRQPGVDERGFTTSADMDLPELDPNTTVIDEPGYTPYYSASTTGGSKAQTPATPPPPPAPAPVESSLPPLMPEDVGDLFAEESGDTWLTQLVDEQGSEIDDFMTMSEDSMPDFDEPVAMADRDDDPFAAVKGMSDGDIAKAQAAGTITPAQELAWLQSKLTQVPDEEEEELFFGSSDMGEVEEASASEMPAWLLAQMPSEGALEQNGEPEFDLNALGSDDISDSFMGEAMGDMDIDALVSSMTSPEVTATSEIPNTLLEGYDDQNETVDPWAFALEKDLEMTGEEPVPDWYNEVVERTNADIAYEESFTPPSTSATLPPELAESLTSDDGTPSWLLDDDQFTPVDEPEGAESDLPEWLRPSVTTSEDAGINDWLFNEQIGVESTPAPRTVTTPASTPSSAVASTEKLPLGEEGVLPGWYAAYFPMPEPEPVRVPPPPAPVAQQPKPTPAPVPEPVRQAPPPPASVAQQPKPTSAPVPEKAVALPAEYAEVQQRLAQNPNDHDSRLNLARNLNRSGNLNESLGQYETLIQKSAMLEMVSTDLSGLIKLAPNHPKARRLLGDVYMRQGRLQEALDTYRGALDKI